MIKKVAIITVITALFIVFSASIAGGIQQKAQATAATQQPTVGSGILVSASQVSVSQQICGYTPNVGYKFVGFYCTVHNVADPGLDVHMGQWILRDTAGGVYQQADPTFCSNMGMFPVIENTQPGDIISGNIIYSVPQNAQLKSITYNGPSNSVIFYL